jgi:AcrR family transcriptional regulator
VTGAAHDEEGGGAVSEECEDEVFVPLRLFYAQAPDGRRGRDRGRRTAGRGERRRQQGGRASRARGLSRADVVRTAIAIADAEGTGALSIRRIARDLGVGPMSLYWYVESTEELHQFMLDQVQGEIEAAEPSGDWRADVHDYAHNMRAALLRHPWAVDYLGIGPPSGPNDARNAERLMAAFDGAEISLTAMMWALMTVVTYVMGAVLREVQEARWRHAVAETTADMTEAEVSDRLGEFNRRVRESGRYPHITKLLDSGIDPDSPDSQRERFEFGLTCVLDGIAAQVTRG